MEMINTVAMMIIKNTVAVNVVMSLKESTEAGAAVNPVNLVHAAAATAAAAAVGVFIYIARRKGEN